MTSLVYGIWNGCNVAAITDKSAVIDLFIERQDNPNLVGGIARAKVTQVRSGGLQAFVGLPHGATGFLHSKTPLKSGQMIDVQVSTYATGNKAWPVSTELKIQNYALIHIMNGKGISASSRLPLTKATLLKQTLKEAKLGGGWIIRHHAKELKPQELVALAQNLLTQKPTLADGADWLLPPLTVLQRAQLETSDTKPQQYAEIQLDDLLQPLMNPEISFGQGSRITISPTPALIAVDIDAGRTTNIDSVNHDAAKAVAAALRSRNIGGQIVIDFCRAKDRTKLLKQLTDCLAADPLSTILYGATKLGLVELTRPRVGPSLWEATNGR